MFRPSSLCILVFAFSLHLSAFATAREDLSRVVLKMESSDAANLKLRDWLRERGQKAEISSGILVYYSGEVPMNITPILSPGSLDRLVFLAVYQAKPEYKGSQQLADLAVRLNSRQNWIQVKLDGEGNLAFSVSLTFIDVISADEFDAVATVFANAIRRLVVESEATKVIQ